MSITVLWLMTMTALLPVDQFAADDPLPPERRQEEEKSRTRMRDSSCTVRRPPVEGIADDQRKGRQNHKKACTKAPAKR